MDWNCQFHNVKVAIHEFLGTLLTPELSIFFWNAEEPEKSVLVEDREMCDYFLILIFKKYLKEYQTFHFYFKYFYLLQIY